MITVTFTSGNPITYKKITGINFYDDFAIISGELPDRDPRDFALSEGQVFDKFLHEYQKILRIDFSD